MAYYEAWIGINAKGGSWVYTSSETELEFQNWYKGRPIPNHIHDFDDFDCVNLYFKNGTWIDYPCTRKNFFICEFV